MNELGKIVRPQSPTRTCKISPEDASHIGLILSETKVKDKSGEKLLGMRSNEIVCALSSKTIFLSNSGQVVSNIDLPYYWCNFCTFKSEDKHLLLKHLMEHRFSCQYCVYQTFSRVDVVRHTVKEHSQYDSDNLKFCVLLPDLLKHGMRDLDETSEQQESSSPPVLQSEDSEKQKPKGGKRKKRGPTEQSPSPKKKKGEEDEEVKKASDQDNTTIVTPGVCFECTICKFRTFQKPVLSAHNNSKHEKPKPSFSLKVVSRSQAKEIEEMDNKLSSKVKKCTELSVRIKRCTKSVKTPNVQPERRYSPRFRPNRVSPCKETEKGNQETEKDEEEEEEEEEESFPAPEVEVDVAAEDDDDDDDDKDQDYCGDKDDNAVDDDDDEYEEDYDDEDDDEDFVPSSIKGKPSSKKRDIEDDNVKKSVKKMYKCLLCPNKTSNWFAIVKKHYIEDHPGGTQVLKEFYDDGTQENDIYFCVGNDCRFQSPEASSWLNHCIQCQKEAMDNPDPHNTCHDSVQNTANTVRENLGLLVVQNADPVDSKPVVVNIQLSPVKQAVQNIKQEVSDADNPSSSSRDQSSDTVYTYGHALPENDAVHQPNLPAIQNPPEIETQPVISQQVTTNIQIPPFAVQQSPQFGAQQTSSLPTLTLSSKRHNALVNRMMMLSRAPVTSNGTTPVHLPPPFTAPPAASTSSTSLVSQVSTPAKGSTQATPASLGTSLTSATTLTSALSSTPSATTSTSSGTSSTSAVTSTSSSTSTSALYSTSRVTTSSTLALSTTSSKATTSSTMSTSTSAPTSSTASTTGPGPSTTTNSVSATSGLVGALDAKPSSDKSEANKLAKINSNDSQSKKNNDSLGSQKAQTNQPGKQTSEKTTDRKSVSTPSKDKTTSMANSNKGTKSTSTSIKQSPSKTGGTEAFNIDQKGNFKCAHCRFLGVKPLEVRAHMLDKHRMNPLYGLDMMAEVNDRPRFMMFCPKETCKFCTKHKDAFLQHFETCTLVEDNKEKMTSEYKKRVEITRNFVNKTLQKLMSLTMG